jgi:hypothetical protein
MEVEFAAKLTELPDGRVAWEVDYADPAMRAARRADSEIEAPNIGSGIAATGLEALQAARQRARWEIRPERVRRVLFTLDSEDPVGS